MIKIKRKKDFKSKIYSNPYFRRKTRNFSFNISWNWKSKLSLIGGFIFILIILYILFFSPILKINYINISGNNRVAQHELLEIAWKQIRTKKFFILPQNNLLLSNKDDLNKAFDNKFSFENISIDKKLAHTLNIEVQEKSYAFVWVENEVYYYSDIDGYIIKEISPLDIKEKKYPIIENQLDNKIVNKKIELNQNVFNFIIDAYNSISTKNEEYKIDKFILSEDQNTIKLKLENGPEIIFNLNNELEAQLAKLGIIKTEKLKNDFDTKSYIDLRFGDRVYYR
jgi:cell division septal protein FtsQ